MEIGIAPPTVGWVLDLDPDLGSALGAGEWEKARRACRGYVLRVRRGIWEPSRELAVQIGRFGFVIVEGMVCRELALGERHMFELLGPGDVVAVPGEGEQARLGGGVILTAAADTVVVGLGEPFIRAAARWPCLLDALLGRLESQRGWLALQALIGHLARAEDRVLLALWLLADRWGRATPEGTVLSLTLTHELLGQLTASRRPTVTIAVSALESVGSVRRLDDGSWLLTEQAECRVAALAGTSPSPDVLGESFILRQLVVRTRHEAWAVRAEARQTQIRACRTDTQRDRRPGNVPQRRSMKTSRGINLPRRWTAATVAPEPQREPPRRSSERSPQAASGARGTSPRGAGRIGSDGT